MANKIKAKLALQLREAGVSANRIYAAHRISKKSQKEVLDAAAALGITYADVADLPDDEVYGLLFPGRNSHASVFGEPDWEYVHREMAKVGVTLQLLHKEYRDVCRESGAVAMGYDRFCKRYGAYTLSKQVTSRVGHKAGRIVEVDWSGPTMAVVNPVTGEVSKVYLFVGTLPFSRYSYVEPTLDMTEDTWLRCHVRMFEFFGGSVPMIVPDNLKTGVTKHPREGEVILNEAYQSMAAHYASAVMAARVRRPKDKPSAEGTVGNIATEVIAALRNQVFTSLDDLKAAVAERLAAYNSAPFQKREGSRLACFEEEERPLLRPLPAAPYEICKWAYGRKVQANCHVCWHHNFYSVSHLYVGRKVDLRITDTVVEIYLGGERLATHKVFPPYARNRYSTAPSDLPREKAYGDWDAGRIRRWSLRVGPSCAGVIERIFESVRYDEQGFNACLAVLRLEHKYTRDRLEKACSMALESGVGSPRYAHIEPILKTDQDRCLDSRGGDDDDDDGAGYVRGAIYYGGAEQ